jgi:pre-mRNA-splicing helicase BRR2
VEALLGPLESDVFAQLVAMGKLFTDYTSEADLAAMTEEGIDDDIGVAVEFEQDDDDEEEV